MFVILYQDEVSITHPAQKPIYDITCISFLNCSLKFKKGNEGRSDLSIHGQSVTMPLVVSKSISHKS